MLTFFFIYETKNTKNGKIYVGKHKTNNLDDGYIGSGKLLKRAILKYGRESFKRRIIQFCSSEEEMNEVEKRLVNLEFCVRSDTYNICVGGQGGFSFFNTEVLNFEDRSLRSLRSASKRNKTMDERYSAEQRRDWAMNARACVNPESFKNRKVREVGTFKHSNETKQQMSENRRITSKGKRNSQFGSIWITNGKLNKKIKSVDVIPEEWYKGRTMGSEPDRRAGTALKAAGTC